MFAPGGGSATGMIKGKGKGKRVRVSGPEQEEEAEKLKKVKIPKPPCDDEFKTGGKTAVVTIGKFQGIHYGHRILIQAVIDTAAQIDGGADPIVFTTPPSKETKKGPHFTVDEKISIMEHMFKGTAPEGMFRGAPTKMGDIFNLGKRRGGGYTTIYLVGGSDRMVTKVDCGATDNDIEWKKLDSTQKECFKDSFHRSVIPYLVNPVCVNVKLKLAAEEEGIGRGDETAPGAPSGKNYRKAAIEWVNSKEGSQEKADALETLRTLMNKGATADQMFKDEDIVQLAETMIANAHPVEGGRRTKRRQKTRYRAKTIKNPKKKRRTHRKKRNTQTMKNKRNRQLV